MAQSITLRIITPERIVLDQQVSSVKVPALDGSMGVLSGHAAMVTALGEGELDYTTDGTEHAMFIAGGFAEVRDNTVRVVTEASEAPTDIDIARADAAAKRARDLLKASARDSKIDMIRAEHALQRALLRQRIAGRRG